MSFFHGMIPRSYYLQQMEEEFEVHSVCALLGPRQCGKTTLCTYFAQKYETVHFFDCENPLHLARLENPMLTFDSLSGLIIIDEVQLRPDLFPVMRTIVDANPLKKFLITGSASRDLIHQSSETLAGRIGYIQITPFSLDEVSDFETLWHRGGYPKSYLASSDALSEKWRDAYIQTFLERDLLSLGFDITPRLMAKLWRMLAQMQGQTLNVHRLAEAIDVDQRTIKRYISLLEGAFMVTVLRPWYANLNKREVKSPKIYIRDSGILFRLLNLDEKNIPFYPQIGFAFEGFVIEAIMRHWNAFETSYFWGVHSGAELDLLIEHKGKKIGFEIKYTENPRLTPSMKSSIQELDLDLLYIVIPLNNTAPFPLSEKVTVIGINQVFTL